MNRSWRESSLWTLLKTTLEEWNADNAARLSAALAYYTIFSVAPLLVLVVAVAGLIYGQEAAQGQLRSNIAAYIQNPDAADLIQTAVKNARVPSTSLMATAVSVALLIWGATGVFGELHGALNNIWDVPPRPAGVRGVVAERALTLLMVLVGGLLLLAALVASTALAAANAWVNERVPGSNGWPEASNFVFFFFVTLVVFTLIYKYVPDVPVAWSDVWAGAVATATLFSVGRLLIAWFIGRSSIVSAYGAASSLALLLLYTYYSAQVFFLGAEFTQVYGRTYGSRRREHVLVAEPIPAEPQQTVQMPGGTILPVGHAVPVVAAAAQVAQADAKPETEAPSQASPAAAPATPGARRRARLRQGAARVMRPLGEVGSALAVVAALSVFNLVAAPLRRSDATRAAAGVQASGGEA